MFIKVKDPDFYSNTDVITDYDKGYPMDYIICRYYRAKCSADSKYNISKARNDVECIVYNHLMELKKQNLCNSL